MALTVHFRMAKRHPSRRRARWRGRFDRWPAHGRLYAGGLEELDRVASACGPERAGRPSLLFSRNEGARLHAVVGSVRIGETAAACHLSCPLEGKGLVKVAQDKVYVAGLKGPLEAGWQNNVEAFASRIPTTIAAHAERPGAAKARRNPRVA